MGCGIEAKQQRGPVLAQCTGKLLTFIALFWRDLIYYVVVVINNNFVVVAINLEINQEMSVHP